MGLGYLQQQPVELAFEDPLEALSVMPEEMPLMFPRGSNSPIPIAQIPDDTGTPDAATGVMIIGFLTRNGQGNNFTPRVLKAMFEAQYKNGGNLTFNSETQDIVVADASGSFLQARRIPVLDLIILNPEDGRPSVVERVNAHAVCRDAINALYNQTLKPLNDFFFLD